MFIIGLVVVVAIAGFILLLAAVVVVTIGVHQEERRLTFLLECAPTWVARCARLVVGSHVRPAEPEPRAADRTATTPDTPDESRAASAEPRAAA